MNITQDDLLEALRDALGGPPESEGVTMADLCASTGYGNKALRRALVALAAQGRLEVGRSRRPTLDGRIAPVPCYRLRGETE